MTECAFDAGVYTEEALNNLEGIGNTSAIWHEIWNDLKQYCVVEQGVTDNYTRDLVLCWGGWVLAEPKDSIRIIYDTISGYNITLRDDFVGDEARRLLSKGIRENSPDQAEVLLGIACDILDREITRVNV